MPVDPVHKRFGRIGRVIENGDFPADEVLFPVSPEEMAGHAGLRFIGVIADGILNRAMEQGDGIVIQVQMGLPDDPGNGSFRLGGGPAAQEGTADEGKQPRRCGRHPAR